MRTAGSRWSYAGAMESPGPAEAGTHDLIVIGASAGGVETLQRVVAGLPRELPASVCVVLHLAPSSPSALAQILDRAGPLPCRTASDGEPLRLGEILVAPPDRHLEIEDGRVRLTVGPRDNGHRPSVDTLFRSAARARKNRVIGVVLSGTRDDGSAGLAVIKAAGGAAVVQDPEEATYDGMPRSALRTVSVDHVVPSTLIASTLASMVEGNTQPGGGSGNETNGSGRHDRSAPAEPPADPPEGERLDAVTICPECGGVLTEQIEANVPHWECRVGHRYSPQNLAAAQSEGIEAALWAAVRALEDRRILLTRIADELEARGHGRSIGSFRERAQVAADQASAVREVLREAAVTSLRQLDEAELADLPDAAEGV